ncbi:MAG: pectate lyase, partial [Armatimonadota bacterium]|nr:pectate lyase [Armatimonadota bacterium]
LQPHSCGGLIQAEGVSVLRSLYINNHTRNPKVKGKNQFVNNVVYNWEVAAYIEGDSAGKSGANVFNNYFIKGPTSKGAPFTRGNENFSIYAAGNYYDDNRDGKPDGRLLAKADYGPVTWLEAPLDYPKVSAMSAAEALKAVIAGAGASLHRDAVDTRLINEDLLSYGKSGHIIRHESEFGGPGEIEGGTAPSDTDGDGMPDEWERQHKLNQEDASDRNGDFDGTGYTNLEKYINALADSQLGIAP